MSAEICVACGKAFGTGNGRFLLEGGPICTECHEGKHSPKWLADRIAHNINGTLAAGLARLDLMALDHPETRDEIVECKRAIHVLRAQVELLRKLLKRTLDPPVKG
jgi:hypothetical protein